MLERRCETRKLVNFTISLRHPLLGVVKAVMRDISSRGLSLSLQESTGFFAMMELDAIIHGEGDDRATQALPVQVVRVQNRDIGLRFRNESMRKAVTPRARHSFFNSN
jgi:hypothetical protein